MLNKANRKKCKKIIKIYPQPQQLLIAMEEMAELIQAISKYIRYGDMEPLLEEYSDVEVVMYELRKMLGIKKKEVNRRSAKKLFKALEGRILIHENLGSGSRKIDAKR